MTRLLRHALVRFLSMMTAIVCLATTFIAESLSAQECSKRIVDAHEALKKFDDVLGRVAYTTFKALRCDENSVFCLGFDGLPLETTQDTKKTRRTEDLPKRVRVGATIRVVTLSPKEDEGRLSIFIEGIPSLDTRGPSSTTPTQPFLGNDGRERCALSQDDYLKFTDLARRQEQIAEALLVAWPPDTQRETVEFWEQLAVALKKVGPSQVVDDRTFTVPSAHGVEITVRRKIGDKPEMQVGHHIIVDRGRYYMDVGVLVPAVFRGERDIYERGDLGTGERRLVVSEGVRIDVAAMLNVFAFGGRGRENLYCANDAKVGACLVGLQVGTSLRRPLRDFYFGLVLEPIAGISMNAGAGLLHSRILPQGVHSDDYIPYGDSVRFRERYFARPYVGVTLGLEALRMLFTVRSASAAYIP